MGLGAPLVRLHTRALGSDLARVPRPRARLRPRPPRAARRFWQLMCVTVLAGFAFVAWLACQSLANILTLCPLCMVTWTFVILIALIIVTFWTQWSMLLRI